MKATTLFMIALIATASTTSAALRGASNVLQQQQGLALPAAAALPARRSVPEGASKAEAATIQQDNILLTLHEKHAGSGKHARLTRAEIRELAMAKIAARVESEHASHARYHARITQGAKPTKARRKDQSHADHRREMQASFRSKLTGHATKAREGLRAASEKANADGNNRRLLTARVTGNNALVGDRRMWSKAGKAITSTWDDAQDFFGGTWDDITDGFDDIVGYLEDMGDYITSIDDHLEDLVDSVFEEVFEIIAVILNGLADGVSASINGAVAGCIEPLAGCLPEAGTELASYEAFGQTVFAATLNNAEFKVCLNNVDLALNMDAAKIEAFYDAIMDNVGDFASAVICPVNEGIMDVLDSVADVLEDVEDAVDDVIGWVGVRRQRRMLAAAVATGKHAAARKLHTRMLLATATAAAASDKRRMDEVAAVYASDDHCTAAAPCDVGYGDCDNDDQCRGALKCFLRDANGPSVPGVSFTASQKEGAGDYCYDASIEVAAVYPGASYCTEAEPCYAGFGDCDNDSQCRGDLQCYQRDAGGATPPGLSFTASQTAGAGDYCYDASIEVAAVYPGASYCTETAPCYAGFGDCDNDAQCRGDLQCFQRDAGGATPPGLSFTASQTAGAGDYCYDGDSSCPVASLSILGSNLEGALRDLMADALVSVETHQLVDLELDVTANAAYVAEGDVLSKLGNYKAVSVDVKVPIFTGILFSFSMDLDIEVPWKVALAAAAHSTFSFHQGSTTTVGVAVAGGGVTRTEVQDADNGLTVSAAIDTLQFSASMGFGIKTFDLTFELATFGASVLVQTRFDWRVLTVGLDVALAGTTTSESSGYDLVGFPSTGGLCTQATVWVGEPSFELGVGYDTVIQPVPCVEVSMLSLGSGAITLASVEGGGVLVAKQIASLGCISL